MHNRYSEGMNAAELSALLILATASSFTPGPNTTLSTALAANRGLRGALHFVLAVPVGWGLQVVIVLTGFLAPAMFIVGGIFALLWGVAIRLGRQVDQARASGSDDASDASAG